MISTFPLDIDADQPGAPGSMARFRADTGIRLRYLEDISDARQFFACIQPQLAAGRTITQDLLVLPSRLTERLIGLGWLDPLPLAEVPNARNLIPSLRTPSWDPQGRYSLPWQSGIAHNVKATGRELTSVDDLFDPAQLGGGPALLRTAGAGPPGRADPTLHRQRLPERSAGGKSGGLHRLVGGCGPAGAGAARSALPRPPKAAACSGPT